MVDEAKKKRGRPAHIPTPTLEKNIEVLAAGGMALDMIAKVVGISIKTLNKYYSKTISQAEAKADAAVVAAAFRMAAGSPIQYDDQGRIIRAEQRPVPGMTAFWLARRRGLKWKEAIDIDPTRDAPGDRRLIIEVRNGGGLPQDEEYDG